MNSGTCTDGIDSYTCTCPTGFTGDNCDNNDCPPNYSGPLCDDFDDCSTEPCVHGGICTDGIDSYTCTSSCYCQPFFTITRSESGDEVASPLTSADYCSSIHGYLDGSQCKCDYRYTFSLEHQTCIDYYNGKKIHFIIHHLTSIVYKSNATF